MNIQAQARGQRPVYCIKYEDSHAIIMCFITTPYQIMPRGYCDRVIQIV